MQSLARVPAKLLKDRALKLLQVQVAPDSNGFGVDLTDFNGIARILVDGAAARSDLQEGDIIIGVDAVDTGSKRLVEVLQHGRDLYVFNVIRPSKPTPDDTVSQSSCLSADAHRTVQSLAVRRLGNATPRRAGG